MASVASKKQGEKSKFPAQRWLEQAFEEHWRERLRADLARHKFKPKPTWLVTPFRGKGIYLAIANDFPFFKVGSSRDVKTRAASLRWVMPGGMRMRNFWPVETWSSSLLRLIEVHIQARLGRWSCDGEWFHTDPKALAIVDTWTELPELAKSPDELRYSWKRLRVWLEHHYALGGV